MNWQAGRYQATRKRGENAKLEKPLKVKRGTDPAICLATRGEIVQVGAVA